MATLPVPLEVAPRNDTLAGPYGRRGDQVGGFFFIHRDDLKRMSTLWLKYTEDVRADDMVNLWGDSGYYIILGRYFEYCEEDPHRENVYLMSRSPQAYKYSGDVYAIHPGDKPWICEMYGYAYGAAKADAWHKWDTFSMIYPGYEPHNTPKLMHYGLLFEINGYKFDKHWHYDFNVTQCPPWDLSSDRRRHGLFANPPRVTTLTNKVNLGTELTSACSPAGVRIEASMFDPIHDLRPIVHDAI